MEKIKRQEFGLSDTEVVKEVQKIYDSVYKESRKVEEFYQQYFEKIRTMNNEHVQKMKEKNPYAFVIAQMQDEKEALCADIGNYKDVHEKKLAIDKWYVDEYSKIQANKIKLSPQEQSNAFSSLQELYGKKSAEAEEEVWKERGEEIGKIVGNGFEDILKDFGDFDGNMRKMSKRLYDYLIEESINAILVQIMGIEKMKNITNALNTGSKKGGWFGAASNIIKGFAGAWSRKKFHSGGIIPVGANAELPGTEEQLALLKGGERILSPSENASYNNQAGGSSPVVFNNFNIKAWDSKDVQKYLLENKHLINSITYEGIKNNNNQLRNMVRNA